MMKKASLLFLNIFLLFSILLMETKCVSNKKTPAPTKVNCLELKIAEFKKTACANGASIKQYHFQNKMVYAFAPGNCGADMTTEIMDETCKTLGFLGGIMGNTQINGEVFPIAENTKVIWESN